MTLDLELLEAIFTNEGNDLRSIAEQNCVMLVFLRQFGCAFCREALDDVSDVKTELDQRKYQSLCLYILLKKIMGIYT